MNENKDDDRIMLSSKQKTHSHEKANVSSRVTEIGNQELDCNLYFKKPNACETLSSNYFLGLVCNFYPTPCYLNCN